MDDDIKAKLHVAKYLDPHFETMSFLDNTTKDEIRNSMKLLVIELIEQQASGEKELLPQ